MSRSIDNIDQWLKDTAWLPSYWGKIVEESWTLETDGCSTAFDWFIWICWEHDYHYRTHQFLCGCPITFEQANYILRERIRQVKFVWWKPVTWFKDVIAWERWVGVQWLLKDVTRKAWDNYGKSSCL